MRIVHVSDFYLPRLGGIEMHVRDLAAHQQADGHTVEILTASPTDVHGFRAPAAHAVTVHRVTEGLVPQSLYHPWALVRGRRVLRDGKYDLVHAHVSLYSPLTFHAAATAVGLGLPLVITAHSLVASGAPVFRGLDAAFSYSDWPATWTAVSDMAAAPLRTLLGPGREVGVLPNGIDPAEWAVERAPRDPDEVVLVTVGRLAPRKRPLHLLHMLREVRRRVEPSVRLRAVLVGDGPERAPMLRYLRRHAMTGWVDLPGSLQRPRIRQLLGRADVFAAPATMETFGIAALEARCTGLPVVARSQSGISEFISDGREGLLADSDDAMVDALVRIVSDPDLRHRLTAHNRATPVSVAWPEVLRRTEQVYFRTIGDAQSACDTPTQSGVGPVDDCAT